jgi:hypothetical protein
VIFNCPNAKGCVADILRAPFPAPFGDWEFRPAAVRTLEPAFAGSVLEALRYRPGK